MIKNIKEKEVFLVITVIITFLIVGIAYLVFQGKEGEEPELPAPSSEEAYEEALKKLGGKEARPLTEEEKQAYEEALKKLGGKEPRPLSEEEKQAYEEALKKLGSQ